MKLLVNGTEHEVEVAPGEPLLWVLRNRLGMTGTKYGCGEGQCGACTVLLDGQAAKSCRVAASNAAGKKITTIEGLAQEGKLHVVQEAFLTEEAFQCGYCTPGMVMATVALLRQKPNPTDAEIIQGMNGNLCRCGTYPRIIAAVRRASGGKA
jgi:aerobic-type carbon monoxide dehydrogenase small subunit (CoxS/CutS family)